jgi:tRNA 2-selenouridine synthase
MTITLDEFLKLRRQLPVADVRSPGEYQAGHIPGTTNIPILNNEERVAVGTIFKEKGQQEAIMTGFRLVGPRLEQIVTDAKKLSGGKEMIVHCWRGGMRSSNFCQFVSMAGVQTHQLLGGYKTYRQHAVESYELPFQFMVVGGKTGSGKSEILRSIEQRGEQVLDLEKLANHKGSAFGGLMMGPQPTTEQFQNELFENILKLDVQKRIWIEDESIAIGKIFLPDPIYQGIRKAPLLRIDVPKEVRVQRLVNEYGHADQAEFLQAMEKITKKLGGQHFQSAKAKLESGDMAATIEILLNYYDRTYSVGMEKREYIVSPTIRWDGKEVSTCASELLQLADALVANA